MTAKGENEGRHFFLIHAFLHLSSKRLHPHDKNSLQELKYTNVAYNLDKLIVNLSQKLELLLWILSSECH